MLDLQPRVHFHEPDSVGAQAFGRISDELDGARADIVDRLGRLDRRRAELFTGRFVHPRRGGFLDHFLVAALQRAVAFEQMDDVAVGVAEHLHLDMAWALDIFFDQHMRVAKRRGSLALARGERVGEVGRVLDLAHPLAPAARDRLDEDGIADLFRLTRQQIGRLIRTHIARRHRHPCRRHQRFGRILQPHRGDAGRRWPNPDQPRIDHGLRELGIFGEKPITRMDRLSPRSERSSNDLLTHQITLARRRRPDMHRLIGLAHMQRLRVSIRINRNSANAHRTRSPNNPASNFAPIGDQK